ncbi:FGGY family carbohydrate kinase [Celerinatantimonas yamalensis]|uniref:FGGY-family carbohydrate kinase n=1 Tax=Celerinatantimonas yamalensis TaxID=559956 RepID=A0ABW9G4V6_9GAMM
MSSPYILSLDEGTTNAKAMSIDQQGHILTKASVPVTLSHSQPGWAEQDPQAIWQAQLEAIKQCLEPLDIQQLSGIAISNQRESVLLWERASGKPLTPLVSWQCRRSVDICETIAQQPAAANIKAISGSELDPLFPASKIVWLLAHTERGYERALAGEICAGTVDAWLVWKLTGGKRFVTDYSNASRYQLFNIHQLRWDPLMLELFHIPERCLPEVVSSCGPRGVTSHVPGLPDGITIHAQLGDSHAALFGQGGFLPGIVKATYGTGSSLMTLMKPTEPPDPRVSTTIAWFDEQPYFAMEGNITHTGAAIQYMAKLLGIHDIDEFSRLAWSSPEYTGVYFIPALSGLGAPHWQPKAKGMITGLTDASSPSILARSAFESVAYQIADLFFAMQEVCGHPLAQLSVDGGPTKNQALMQFQADLLQVPLIKNNVAEVSALGAAYLAGKSLGWWPTYQDIAALEQHVEMIKPNPDASLIQAKYSEWKALIEQICL